MLTKSMLYVMTLYICDVNIVLDGIVLVFLMISHQNEYGPEILRLPLIEAFLR